jgi:hypothetical protein
VTVGQWFTQTQEEERQSYGQNAFKKEVRVMRKKMFLSVAPIACFTILAPWRVDPLPDQKSLA